MLDARDERVYTGYEVGQKRLAHTQEQLRGCEVAVAATRNGTELPRGEAEASAWRLGGKTATQASECGDNGGGWR